MLAIIPQKSPSFTTNEQIPPKRNTSWFAVLLLHEKHWFLLCPASPRASFGPAELLDDPTHYQDRLSVRNRWYCRWRQKPGWSWLLHWFQLTRSSLTLVILGHDIQKGNWLANNTFNLQCVELRVRLDSIVSCASNRVNKVSSFLAIAYADLSLGCVLCNRRWLHSEHPCRPCQLAERPLFVPAHFRRFAARCLFTSSCPPRHIIFPSISTCSPIPKMNSCRRNNP